MQKSVSDADWFEMNCRPGTEVNIMGSSFQVPLLPPDDVQLRFTGRTSRQNLEQAFEFYKLVLDQSTNLESVVDFGGGWGRILRFFLREVKPDQLYLLDCLADAIDEAKRTNAPFHIIQTIPGQSFPLTNDSIDVVYAFSVFSHLSEAASRQSLREFSRILKKDGIAVITTRGQWHFDYLRKCKASYLSKCKALLTNKPLDHIEQVSQAIPDMDELEKALARGEYQFFPTGGGGELSSDFYGEAWIGENWIKENLRELGYSSYELYLEKGSIDQVTFVLHK